MHEHNHHHHHDHCHNNKNLKRLSIVFSVTALYMIAEFIGGYFTNSLALMADAGHMLGDTASLALSFGAIWLASRKAPLQKSFGYYRAEIIAAFLNGLALIIIAGMIFCEAFHRFQTVQTVDAPIMLLVALGGLIVNIIGVCVLHSGTKENLNVKGAFLHIIADLLGSIGAISAGILMAVFGWYIADPIISFVIAFLVLISSFGIIKSAFNILMESVPENIDIEEVKISLMNIEGVKSVHDLHIWCINSNTISLSVHIVKNKDFDGDLLSKIVCSLKENFEISHSTIQIEPENFPEDKCMFAHED
ncbi:cation transporter [bacterium]|nr:cation transporter [bacterium]